MSLKELCFLWKIFHFGTVFSIVLVYPNKIGNIWKKFMVVIEKQQKNATSNSNTLYDSTTTIPLLGMGNRVTAATRTTNTRHATSNDATTSAACSVFVLWEASSLLIWKRNFVTRTSYQNVSKILLKL